MPKPLVKIATRFYLPICFEAAYRAQVVHLKELVGDSFSAVIARFDGKKMDVFRVAEDIDRLKPKIIAYAQTPAFAEALPGFERDIAAYLELAKRDDADAAELIERFSHLYQYAVLGSFLTNFWSADIPANRAEDVLATATKFRVQADYLMRALTEHFEKRFARLGWSQLCSLEAIQKNDASVDTWKEDWFTFRNGEFFDESWADFLKRNDYTYDESVLEAGSMNEVKGMAAFAGVVRGTVRIVFSPRDLAGVQEGDVLVAAMTTPSFASVFPKVAAIVTDEGGMTCHAAIIARELQKPCVIGTKMATVVFHDGDMVEVDAGRGTVTLLS
jgi:phosphohistidine swiveling domain-containing protein